ncbi:FUSC family protein [Mucilaginibacter arboris]|uniref:FUSC family protein n=1 Tax=Mucilaginibacter arboris TaxID=2682090 RepID=A0A7K1SX74_9SPHI|nr:FUSC family protein [Mucilaginibacter arboris]MVN21931.1 FUSC family protein [Mucilaginibacter arboris]
MDQKQIDFLLYVLKCLIGAAIGFFIYRAFPEGGAWTLVSILLVLSPEGKDAINLAEVRIKANLVGAGTGLLLFFLHPPAFFMICLGVIIVLVVCELLKLQVAARSALASVVIICIHESGKYFWQIAVERAGGVVGGCLIALLITYIVHYKSLIHNVRERKARISWRRNQFKKQQEESEPQV